MVDIHCHILHNYDDGASSLDESLEMARMAAQTGVTDIVVTPHFEGRASSLRRLPILVEHFEELTQAIALGDLKGLDELRQVVRNSEVVETWTPNHTPEWDEAYAKLLTFLK